jgi:hypothetical protein
MLRRVLLNSASEFTGLGEVAPFFGAEYDGPEIGRNFSRGGGDDNPRGSTIAPLSFLSFLHHVDPLGLTSTCKYSHVGVGVADLPLSFVGGTRFIVPFFTRGLRLKSLSFLGLSSDDPWLCRHQQPNIAFLP